MPEVKIGDKVRLVNKPVWVGAYEEGETGVVIERDVFGDAAPYGHILVALDKGVDRTYDIPHGQYEVIQDAEHKDNHQDIFKAADLNFVEEASAESLRSKILSIREKRNDLKMEIIALDKEEADCVEKLKNLGFVLHEEASSSDGAEEKTVLYADDIDEDMTDPRNWKVGDVIESLDSDIAPFGSLATITEIDGDILYRSGGEGFTCGYFGAETKSIWKFHSRPL